MAGQGLSTCLYQHTPRQSLPGGYRKCRTDVHLSQYHVGHFPCSSTNLAPSHFHCYEEKNLLHSSCHLDSLSSTPPAHRVSVYKCQFKKKIKLKITYFVSFIFTYHVYACLFFSPACYGFSEHLLQHFLHHDLYRRRGAASCCRSPGAADPARKILIDS